MDKLAIQFIKDKATREKVQKEAADIAGELKSRYATYYAKIMEKVIEKGDEFLSTEKARIAKITGSEDITSAKLDDFSMRKNILAAFDKLATPVEE